MRRGKERKDERLRLRASQLRQRPVDEIPSLLIYVGVTEDQVPALMGTGGGGRRYRMR